MLAIDLYGRLARFGRWVLDRAVEGEAPNRIKVVVKSVDILQDLLPSLRFFRDQRPVFLGCVMLAKEKYNIFAISY